VNIPECFGCVSPVPDPECVPCDFLGRCREASRPRVSPALVEVTRDGRMFENAVSGFDSGILIRLHLRRGGSFEHATGLSLRWYDRGRYRLKAVTPGGRMVVGFARLDCRACELDFAGVSAADMLRIGADRVGNIWRLRCRSLERKWEAVVTALVLRNVEKSSRRKGRGSVT